MKRPKHNGAREETALGWADVNGGIAWFGLWFDAPEAKGRKQLAGAERIADGNRRRG